MTPHRIALILALFVAAPLSAQSSKSDPMAGTTVRTFQLHYLSSKDAAQLVAPYVIPGRVFEAGRSTHAITVRDHADVLNRIDSLLKAYDRPPRTVVLRFQLIVGTDQPTSDAAIGDVDRALRSLFNYRGYRQVAEGVAVVGESSDYVLTLGGDGNRYAIRGNVGAVSRGEEPTARLTISVSPVTTSESDSAIGASAVRSMLQVGTLISTQITTRFGRSVVLGSGTEGAGKTVLILVVRPELSSE